MKSLSKYSVWITLGLPIALCLTISCSALHQKRRIKACGLAFEEVKNCWEKDPESGLYYLKECATAEHGFGYSKNDECFTGLVRSDIEKLFGKPDSVLRGNLYYYMSGPCLETQGMNTGGCRSAVVVFGAEEVVQEIKIIIVSADIDYLDPGPGPYKWKQ